MPEALLCTERLLRLLLCACVSRPPRLLSMSSSFIKPGCSSLSAPQAVRPHSEAPRPAFCLAADGWSLPWPLQRRLWGWHCVALIGLPACLLETNFCNKLVRLGWVGGRGSSARLTSCPHPQRQAHPRPLRPLPISISMQDMKWACPSVCLSIRSSVRLCKGLG